MMTHRAVASLYDSTYFSERSARALASARVVVPLVLRLTQPRSVIDVGCAQGEWLKAFEEQGVKRIQGLDGDYVDQSRLLIPQACFRAVDLEHLTEIETGFDLAVCLEVAEHLHPRSSLALVRNLVRASPLVLFSAALPHQEGTGHINEQWPRYWQLAFAEHDYQRLDLIRPVIWHDRRVAWWYQQNIFLFASREAIAASEIFKEAAQPALGPQLELVSEHILARMTSLRGLLRELPPATGRTIRKHLRRWGMIRN